MLVSLNWLNERLDLSGKSVDELDDLLTFAGIEVEGVHVQGPATDRVVVAVVVAAEKHPNADRLKVCQVETGEGAPRQIVCGAQNYRVGDKVPCALPGAKLPSGLEIKNGKLRGIESAGMLCSASELGYTDAEDGLMILPTATPLGQPVRELLGSDTIFELEITPNRPDLLSHSGMARELAALLGSDWQPVETCAPKMVDPADSVHLEATEACPFYSAIRMDGITVAESPAWLKTKLEAIGLRPINNVVDITNYVLHELGQPLHAFDAAQVALPLHIRLAREGEEFLALDEQTYSLQPEDVVISDGSGAALALGGVMGGLSSGTTASTKSLVLESALFDASTIRRTSRRLGLTSDSSYRFERGVDPAGVVPAAGFAAQLIVELAGGQIVAAAAAGTLETEESVIEFDQLALDRLTAGSVPWNKGQMILKSLGLQELQPNRWSVPSYRRDLRRGVDLVEEVVRVHGLDKIPSCHATTLVEPLGQDAEYDLELQLKQQLAALGFFEAQTIKLISQQQLPDALPLRPLQEGDLICVSRPLSEDHAILRPALTPGLMAVAALNARQHARSLRFFETGTVFRNSGGGQAVDLEGQSLGLLLSGPRAPTRWDEPTTPACDLFDVKAVIQSLLPQGDIEFSSRDRDGFFLGCDILLDGKRIGVAAMTTPARTRELDIEHPVYVAEVDLARILAGVRGTQKINELPQYPASTRDMAIEAPLELSHAEILKAIQKLNQPLLTSCFCFDLFTDPTGKKLAADKKSMAYSLTYRSDKGTLTNEQVTAAHEEVLQSLTDSLPITFR